MEQIKKFLHGKGFALLLTASLLAAAAAGVWAVRALRAELQKSGCSAFLRVFFVPLHKPPATVPH